MPYVSSLRALGLINNAEHPRKGGRSNPIRSGRINPIPDNLKGTFVRSLARKKPSDNEATDNQSTTPNSTEELIGQAEQLKVSLRDTLSQTSELIVGLKRHRKEAKIVRSTLASLQQLQTVG